MRIHEVWKEIQSIFIVLSSLTQMWRLGEPKASMPKPMGMRRQLGKGTVICSNSIVLTCFKDLLTATISRNGLGISKLLPISYAIVSN